MLLTQPIDIEPPGSVAMSYLRGLPIERIGVREGTFAKLSAGLPRYMLTPERLHARQSLANAAFRWGWRFFAVADERTIPVAVDVRPSPDAGTWTAGLATGSALAAQLSAIARLSNEEDVVEELRLLDTRGLGWSGIWLAGTSDRVLALPSLRRANPKRLLARLRARAGLLQNTRVHEGIDHALT